MKTLTVFLRIWVTIVFLFSLLFTYAEKNHHADLESMVGNFMVTFVFSIVPALILLVFLYISEFIGDRNYLPVRLLLLYSIAAVTIWIYGSGFGEIQRIREVMYVSVFTSLFVWTRPIIDLWTANETRAIIENEEKGNGFDSSSNV